MPNHKMYPRVSEETDGSICPACLGTQVQYDVCSYLTGVSAPDGYCERVTEERGHCLDCGENFPLVVQAGVRYGPEELKRAMEGLIHG